MTITNAFKELISDNAEWYRVTGMNKIEADALRLGFINSGEQKDAIKKLLSGAGYIVTETWSKLKADQVNQIVNNKFIHPANKTIIKGASVSEIALIRQANNPLGDPNKV